MGAPSLDELNAIAGPLLSANKSLNLGPFIIGLILDTLLCGILLMQCGAYFSHVKNDRLYLKGIVAYVMLMNIVITVYTWTWIYDLFVYNFGTYGLFLSLKYISQYYILDSMTVIVVQGFFAIRAWKVSGRNYFVLGVISAFALAAFGGGIGVKVMFMQVGSTLRAGDVKVPAYVWLFGTVAADLIITVIIMYYLLTNRKSGIQATGDVVGRLARVTFESQLPPTLIAIGLAIEYTIQYSSFIAIPFICVQAKFYGISLMHTLNSREVLRSVGSTLAAEDGDIEFAKRSQNTFWLSSRFTTNEAPRAMKGDTHRHTQFTIMPEPRTRRTKAESIDTVSFGGGDLGDLGDDEDARTSRSREGGTRKTSEADLGDGGISIVDDTPPQRPNRGGEYKLASMGLGGTVGVMDGDRNRP